MASISRVKERAEEQSTTMSVDQQATIRMLANDLHRLNQSVMKAVEAGVSQGWDRWVDRVVAIDRFGASAPGALVLEKLGITAENTARAARELLGALTA